MADANFLDSVQWVFGMQEAPTYYMREVSLGLRTLGYLCTTCLRALDSSKTLLGFEDEQCSLAEETRIVESETIPREHRTLGHIDRVARRNLLPTP